MALRLEIESSTVNGLDDIYDAVARLPGLPEWFGRNLGALGELAFVVKQALHIVVHHPKALERRLGTRDFRALMQTLEDIRDSELRDGAQPTTLTINP